MLISYFRSVINLFVLMKRNVLILVCLLAFTTAASAQKKKKSTTQDAAAVSTLSIPGTAFLRPIALSSASDQPAVDYKQSNAPLPDFLVINNEGKDITKELTRSGGNLIMMMFNPTCDHCQDETRLFIQNLFLFQKSRVLLVAAPVQTPNLGYFESVMHTSLYPSTITVAIDSAKVIDRLFTYKNLPQINIYDGKHMRLLRTFEGFVPLDSLKQYIQ